MVKRSTVFRNNNLDDMKIQTEILIIMVVEFQKHNLFIKHHNKILLFNNIVAILVKVMLHIP